MLTVATKKFDDVHGSTQWSLAPGLTWRAGQGVDVLAQYVHTEYGAALGGGMDRIFQIGLAFSLEARYQRYHRPTQFHSESGTWLHS